MSGRRRLVGAPGWAGTCVSLRQAGAAQRASFPLGETRRARLPPLRVLRECLTSPYHSPLNSASHLPPFLSPPALHLPSSACVVAAAASCARRARRCTRVRVWCWWFRIPNAACYAVDPADGWLSGTPERTTARTSSRRARAPTQSLMLFLSNVYRGAAAAAREISVIRS